MKFIYLLFDYFIFFRNSNIKNIKKNVIQKDHIIKNESNRITVNSFHHFAIKNCPKNFKIKFKAEDEVIESICSINSKMEGWMWHPERYKKFKSFDIKSFKNLFK